MSDLWCVSLPDKIRERLEALEMDQHELAEKLGVAQSTVNGWIKGTHGIRMGRLPRLAKVLKTTVEDLVAA
jgi:transcriptional regulator with XRE-family HTH domain